MAFKKILALTDFSEAAAVSLENAFSLVNLAVAKEFAVIHMVAEQTEMQQTVEKIKKQCSTIANRVDETSYEALAFIGKGFGDIVSYLNNSGADLVIMPTHGKKDIQFLLGSYAMKVISQTQVPIIIYQQNALVEIPKEILVPVFANESITSERLKPLIDMALTYKSSIRLLAPTYGNEDEMRSVETAVIRLGKQLTMNNIEFNTTMSINGYAKFKEVILHEAQRHKSQLIALLSGKDAKRSEVIQPKELHQTMVTNKLQIPVLCV